MKKIIPLFVIIFMALAISVHADGMYTATSVACSSGCDLTNFNDGNWDTSTYGASPGIYGGTDVYFNYSTGVAIDGSINQELTLKQYLDTMGTPVANIYIWDNTNLQWYQIGTDNTKQDTSLKYYIIPNNPDLWTIDGLFQFRIQYVYAMRVDLYGAALQYSPATACTVTNVILNTANRTEASYYIMSTCNMDQVTCTGSYEVLPLQAAVIGYFENQVFTVVDNQIIDTIEYPEWYNEGMATGYRINMNCDGISMTQQDIYFPQTCSFCTETCSPCGGGCTATDLSHMYENYDFNADPNGVGDITGWDTSCITDMSYMFKFSNFNQDINAWDISQVTTLREMFWGNMGFNQPLNNWNTAAVTDMYGVFVGDGAFNQPLNNWNTAAVTNMAYLFSYSGFNQDISMWDVSHVWTMERMFDGDTAFNQDISAWNVGSLTWAGGFGGDAEWRPINLSTQYYDNILNAWDDNVMSGVTIGFGVSQYSAAGLEARNRLTTLYGWSITDGGCDGSCCVENWTYVNQCDGIISEYTKIYEDANMCGTLNSLPSDNNTIISCSHWIDNHTCYQENVEDTLCGNSAGSITKAGSDTWDGFDANYETHTAYGAEGDANIYYNIPANISSIVSRIKYGGTEYNYTIPQVCYQNKETLMLTPSGTGFYCAYESTYDTQLAEGFTADLYDEGVYWHFTQPVVRKSGGSGSWPADAVGEGVKTPTTTKGTSLSVGGAQSFNIQEWFNDLWTKIKELFVR
jgi:surface protein